LIIQSTSYFSLIDVETGIITYNYEGRQVSVTKIPGGKLKFLSRKKISLSHDIIAVIDQMNSKIIRLYDVQSGKQQSFSLDHGLDIIEIDLNKTKVSSERKIAFVDSNRDLFMNPALKRKKVGSGMVVGIVVIGLDEIGKHDGLLPLERPQRHPLRNLRPAPPHVVLPQRGRGRQGDYGDDEVGQGVA